MERVRILGETDKHILGKPVGKCRGLSSVSCQFTRGSHLTSEMQYSALESLGLGGNAKYRSLSPTRLPSGAVSRGPTCRTLKGLVQFKDRLTISARSRSSLSMLSLCRSTIVLLYTQTRTPAAQRGRLWRVCFERSIRDDSMFTTHTGVSFSLDTQTTTNPTMHTPLDTNLEIQKCSSIRRVLETSERQDASG